MFQEIKITQNTTALVKNGKVIYLIQKGKITQDPLKVRHFQRMIWKTFVQYWQPKDSHIEYRYKK